MSERPLSLVLVGAGKMGSALLGGWFGRGVDGKSITIIDPAPAEEVRMSAHYKGVRLNPPIGEIGSPAVLFLAVKPQSLDEVVPQIASLVGPNTLVISIIAGKTTANLKARLPAANAIVRAMPNTPAAIRRGITAVFATPDVRPEQRMIADELLSAVGRVEWLDDEGHIDAVTAVSGSGPAYVFLLAECLAEAGATAGLPPDLAGRLARATVEGSGELMHRSPEKLVSKLREEVTSPAGTTAAALAVLMSESGLKPLMEAAVSAAKRRAGELSG
ncbi:MAG: pyrroline-5-carboxylate reductase [Beijerinckiaceae bacterium]